MEATVHRPGEGETIGGPTTVTIKATGEETNDSFYLGEVVIEPRFPALRRIDTSACTTCSTSSTAR
jgi:hypothetical protein